MQCYVCVKHVPDSGALIELSGDTGIVEDNVKYIINPFDEYGIEEALTLAAAHGGEVVIVCAGNAGAIATIRAALAMGADRGIHILTTAQTSSAHVARLAAKAISQDKAPDIIFTGKQSIDGEGGIFPYMLAKELEMPIVNDVSELEIEATHIVASRETGGGARQRIRAARPCVLGTTRGLNTPRYPKLPDIMKAKKKTVQEIPAASLEVQDAPAPVLQKLELVPERAGARLFAGSVPEQVKELVRVLREEEQVL